MTKEQWEAEAKRVVDGYLERKDGHFDDTMCAHFHSCDFEEQSISIEFTTQPWQRNERDGIHGGAIAGMFDTACGVVANFAAPDEAATSDMYVSYVRPLELGQHAILKTWIVRSGRSMIRLRAEMICKESGKLIATSVSNWIPL
ncbi:MAG: PaaI family thioesterase [Firmicutes bacterium]|nr:PaaI family thioesterase [Bacillota bacterium]